jgi:hypothetical protein
MVLDMINDFAESGPALVFYGLVLTLVGLRHIVMPEGSLIDVLTSPVFQDQVRMLVSRLAGVVVTAGGLGILGNGAEKLGIY